MVKDIEWANGSIPSKNGLPKRLPANDRCHKPRNSQHRFQNTRQDLPINPANPHKPPDPKPVYQHIGPHLQGFCGQPKLHCE